MNDLTFATLEYDRIKEALAAFTVSGLGRRLAFELRPATDARAVAQMLRETTETRAILDAAGHIPLHGLSDVSEAVERVALGGVLDPAALTAMGDLLRGCRRLKSFLARHREIAPLVSGYAGALTECPELEEEIERSIEGGRISSAASPRLAKVRARMEIVKGRVKDKMHAFLTSDRYREALQEQIVSVKDGRYVLAVKASMRQRIEGAVVAASGSGQTVFVEPANVRDLTNELKLLAAEEEAEEYQVLCRLTGGLAARIQAVRLNVETMAAMDFACAKAKYSRAISAVPAEPARGRRIVIRRGRHPLLGRDAVPLDFHIGGEFRTLLVTGPNTGGKTVVLKTVGLFALMNQSGLHVPAEEGTALCVFDRVLVDIGDRQSIEQSLSTFSSHMGNIVGILREAGEGSLVLLDEIGTGTDPAEGAALAAAVLDDLHAAGALTVATTHYGDLKRFSDRHPGFCNGCMEFDAQTLRPLYTLVIGRAGRSNGLWIAQRLGMPESTLAKAREFGAPAAPSADGGVEEIPASAQIPPLEEKRGVIVGEHDSPPSQSEEERIGTIPTRDPDLADKGEPARPLRIGDSVYVGSLGENGILCETADARGEVAVLVREKRIRVNQKRVRLHIPAEELYPDLENYDLNIVLLSKQDRKLVNRMKKRHVEGEVRVVQEPQSQDGLKVRRPGRP
ncbi:MAG: endonuclease MutS2 [Patescibacteria group bacterium]